MTLESFVELLGLIFFLLIGICGCIYGLSPSNKYAQYRKSDEHYNDGDNT